MKLTERTNARAGMAALAAAGALLVFSAVAQQEPGSQGKKDEPVLRATSRLVLVSAIVRDKNGEPVRGLTKDDFAVLDDGKPQAIATFSAVVSEGAPRTRAAAATPLLSSTFTNREDRVSEVTPVVTVILLDMLNTAAKDSLYGQQQIVQFLLQLQPQDRVALYVLSSRGVRVLLDFTSDPEPLLRALKRYRGREEPQVSATDPEATKTGNRELDDFLQNTSNLQSGFFLRDRVRRTVDALVAISDHLLRVPGRKNLVWVSGSFPISYGFDRLYESTRGSDSSDKSAAAALEALAKGPEQPTNQGGRGGPPLPTPPRATKDPDLLVASEQEVFWKDLERAARALNQANLAIYPVDARGLMTAFPNPNFNPTAVAKGQGPAIPEFTKGGPDRKEFDTMNVLAERTGGRAFYNANEINVSVRQAIDESRVTYELGYYPVHNKWDAKFHEITVRVKRPGLNVRHRRGYFAVADAPAGDTKQAELLQAAADSPLESAVLGLKVRLERVAGADARKLNLRIELDTKEVSLAREGDRWVGALAVLVAQRKSSGESTFGGAQTVNLNLVQATYEKLQREGIKLTKPIQLEPGAEELRVVVRDASSGATGSVYILLERWRDAP
jgi:VWFA-related protein